MKKEWKLLGEICVEKSFCKKEDIERALQVQKSYGGKIGNILLNMGLITEGQLLEALSAQFGFNYLKEINELQAIDIGIDPNFFVNWNVYPVSQNEKIIEVITNNPLNLEAFSLIESRAKKKVVISLTTESNLRALSDACYENSLIQTENQTLDIDEEIEKLKELASEAPVIKLVNTFMTKAVEENATDIHFESMKRGMKVRFRVDGRLRTVETIPDALKLAVITRVKLLSGMNIAENRLPQDGRINVKVAGKSIDIRVSSMPTQLGESLVLRLLGKENIDYSLESLGFYSDHIKLIRKIISKPNGIFLTTGPTGSGKTTTLYSMLSELNSEDVKIITVEDPVEYELSGINQINVKPEIGNTFSNALRSILRQDPDIIMIGEIRDKETAEIAIHAALTGHLVLSTLHTNSALSAITRLLDMGIASYLIRAAVIGFMAQRLVRKLCPNCAAETELPEDILERFKFDWLLKKYPYVRYLPRKAVGCQRCNNLGYKGRTVIAEIAPFDLRLQKEFDNNKNFDNLNKLGHRTMLQDGILRVAEGSTSLEEVLKVVQ